MRHGYYVADGACLSNFCQKFRDSGAEGENKMAVRLKM